MTPPTLVNLPIHAAINNGETDATTRQGLRVAPSGATVRSTG
jgi:hypothetical protein